MAYRYKGVRPSFMKLPEELQVEIFLRLHARSLLMCKCVCKVFRAVIQNPYFEHTLRTLNKSIPSACTSNFLLSQSNHGIYVVSIENTTDDVISCSPLTPIIPSVYKLFLVGSCNGLVCFSARTTKGETRLLLWNPVTSTTRYLPEPQKDGYIFKNRRSTEFCYVPETNDYIVLIIGSPSATDSRIHVAVYKMSTDSWTIHCSNIPILHCSVHNLKHQITSVFVNGAFHWGVNGHGCNIVSYNLNDEKFREIKTPIDHAEFLCNTEWNIAVIDETLGVMYWNNRIKGNVLMHKMKDYGVQDSWLWLEFHKPLLAPLLGHWKDSLITTDSSNLYLYNYCTHERKQWIPQSGLPRLCNFVPF